MTDRDRTRALLAADAASPLALRTGAREPKQEREAVRYSADDGGEG